MKRALLAELLHEAVRLTGERELIVIRSQAIHGATEDVPPEVVMSRECDLLLDEADPAATALDAALGPDSPIAVERFVHIDTVSSTFAFLPPGWEERLVSMEALAPHVRCLEVHDLVVSKLAAGRLKDYELVAVLTARAIADPGLVRQRIEAVLDVRMRAILLARLQIVLESAPR